MSILPEENPSNLNSSSEDDDYENGYEDFNDDPEDNCEDGNSTDSANLEDDEDDGSDTIGLFPLQCNLSDRVVSGSLVVQIDQAPLSISTRLSTGAPYNAAASGGGAGEINPTGTSFVATIPLGNNDNRNNESDAQSGLNGPSQPAMSTSSASLSTSDNISTRATIGSGSVTESVSNTDTVGSGEAVAEREINSAEQDNENGNSSPPSLNEEEAERVREIHNSIFSSLEHDLAELVRIREETIQFLESGVRADEEEDLASSRNNNSERGQGVGEGNDDPLVLRERLTYHSTRPRVIGATRHPHTAPSATTPAGFECSGDGDSTNRNTIKMDGRSYTIMGNYENGPPGHPAKPYVEVGLTSCDEKAIAAKQIMKKLQFGDPEDEAACLIRRFWRDTSTVEDNTPARAGSALSVDIAAIAERTASLEASLEEAFDGLRLRLRQMRPDESTPANSETSQQPPTTETTAAGAETGTLEPPEENRVNNNVESQTNSRNETSPSDALMYQAWDEETSILDNPLNYDIFNEFDEESDAVIAARINMAERRTSTLRQLRNAENNHASGGNNVSNSVSVGTDPILNGEDDDSTEDEEIANYLQFRNFCHNQQERGRSQLFQDIGISDEIGEELANMFTFSEEELRIPSLSINDNPGDSNNADEANNDEIPLPLFPRRREEEGETRPNGLVNDDRSRDEDDIEDSNISLAFNSTPSIEINPNREDDSCSAHVYLDESNLNFSLNLQNNLQDNDSQGAIEDE